MKRTALLYLAATLIWMCFTALTLLQSLNAQNRPATVRPSDYANEQQYYAMYWAKYSRVDLTPENETAKWPWTTQDATFNVASNQVLTTEQQTPPIIKQLAQEVNNLCMIRIQKNKLILVFHSQQSLPQLADLNKQLRRILLKPVAKGWISILWASCEDDKC